MGETGIGEASPTIEWFEAPDVSLKAEGPL
jgi:hypothetical protein